MRENELPKRIVEREAVDISALHGEDQLRRRPVHGESGRHELGAGLAHVLRRAGAPVAEPVDAEDGADRDAGVQVAGSVNGVADHGVASVSREDDGFLLFFGHEDLDLSAATHHVDEDVVANHVELLLVIAGRVGRARETDELPSCLSAQAHVQRQRGSH